jgi:hypothetical protein
MYAMVATELALAVSIHRPSWWRWFYGFQKANGETGTLITEKNTSCLADMYQRKCD